MKKIAIILFNFLIVTFIFSQEKIVNFDDNQIITIPTSTPTPIYKMLKQEIVVWDLLSKSKNLIERCEHGLKNYPKLFKTNMDKGFLNMQKVIASIHTAAVLHKRDNIEYAWEEAIKEPTETLSMGENFLSEFDEDIKEIEKNQKEVKKIFDKYHKKMQNPHEIKLKYNSIEKELFFAKKEIKKFKETFENYKAKYNKIVNEKEKKIETLIAEHKALHKP